MEEVDEREREHRSVMDFVFSLIRRGQVRLVMGDAVGIDNDDDEDDDSDSDYDALGQVRLVMGDAVGIDNDDEEDDDSDSDYDALGQVRLVMGDAVGIDNDDEEDDDSDSDYDALGQVRLVMGDAVGIDNDDEEDDDSDSDYDALYDSRDGGYFRSKDVQSCKSDVSSLKPNGLDLAVRQSSGCYSKPGRYEDGLCITNLHKRLMARQYGRANRSCTFSNGDRRYCQNIFLPNTMRKVKKHGSKVFCGQYSKDGERFVAATQDSRIYVYDTSDDGFKLETMVYARDVGWSIIDVVVSPDRRHIIYSSWSDYVHQCRVDVDSDDEHVALPLMPSQSRFCVFSLSFSQSGNEILAGASDHCVYVYDRERNSKCLQFRAHEDDVNAVTFADESSHIVFSGGDDGFCKVWDRRCLNEINPVPVGILAGHMDGITYIDSRNDTRYLLSNSKDQTIKLWDIRRFSDKTAQQETAEAVSRQHWDYRWQSVPKLAIRNRRRLEGDSSVATYRGHVVLHTLIRAFFSPAHTTGQRFIYTGCASGKIKVFDVLTGEMVPLPSASHNSCVRDVSWHPYRNQICSSSWDGHIGLWYYDGEVAAGELEADPDLAGVKPADGSSKRPKQLRRSARIACRNLGSRNGMQL